MARELIEASFDYDITEDERKHAYQWLNSWGNAERNLSLFTPHQLMVFIVYEVNNKRRTYVIDRLLGRFSKLRRQMEWKQLQKMVEEKNARARNRAISLSTSGGERWNSDKTDIF